MTPPSASRSRRFAVPPPSATRPRAPSTPAPSAGRRPASATEIDQAESRRALREAIVLLILLVGVLYAFANRHDLPALENVNARSSATSPRFSSY